jgi:hypothetical protein
MAPDFAYVVAGTSLDFDAHDAVGLVVFCVPVTVTLTHLTRRVLAPVVFALTPNLGPLHLRDFRVLSMGQRPVRVTVLCAFLGAASHAVWDAFTHDHRAGARWFPWLRTHVATVGGRSYSLARTLQYTGHVGGSLVAVALLAYIGRRRLLVRWYGDAARVLSTQPPPPREHGVVVVVVAIACALLGMCVSQHAKTSTFVLRVAAMVALGVSAVAVTLRAHPAYASSMSSMRSNRN